MKTIHTFSGIIPTQVFTTHTREIYNTLCESLFDIVSDGSNPVAIEQYSELLSSVARGDMEKIRQAFVDGMSPQLVPHLMNEIDTDEINSEIRVFHNGKLIGVVIHDEIVL